MKTLYNFKKYLVSFPKGIYLINFIAVFVIALIVFFPCFTPSVLSWDTKLGALVIQLMSAIIASSIFYIFEVYAPKQKEIFTITPILRTKALRIIGDGRSISNAMGKIGGIEVVDRFLSDEEVDLLCKQISPKGEAPLVIGNERRTANWVEYFDYHKKRTLEIVQVIFSRLRTSDADLVKILLEIEGCSFYYTIEIFKNFEFKNESMETWSSNLKQYFVILNDLQSYIDNKM